MKNTLIIVNAALIIAVVILFVLVLRGKSGMDEISDNGGMIVNESGAFELAYINTDSFVINYEYASYLSEQLIRKEESSKADFNERARIFQNDMVEFQRKVQNNSFLSLERAQSEEKRLIQKEAELQDLNTRLSNELMEEQGRMNLRLRDTLTNFLNGYCIDKPYKIVLSNTMGDNILYSVDGLDITDDVVKKLNIRYSASQKK